MEKENQIKSPEVSNAEQSGEKTISVKFNKEVKEIPLEEAIVLVQKGLKFDAVSSILERIKAIAESKGKGVGEYIAELEKNQAIESAQSLIDGCSDKKALLEAIVNLGAKKAPKIIGFDELQAAYPEIDDVSKVPEEVLQNAKLYGRNLFDEYLRYLFEAKKREEKIKKAESDNQSVGSQSKKDNGSFDPISSRFLKGLWGN